MAELAVQKVSTAGLSPSFDAAAAGGDTFQNTGKEFLYVKNGSAGALGVQVDSTRKCDQGFDHDVEVSVDAGGEELLGPFESGRFGATANVSYPDGVTSLTVAVIRVPVV